MTLSQYGGGHGQSNITMWQSAILDHTYKLVSTRLNAYTMPDLFFITPVPFRSMYHFISTLIIFFLHTKIQNGIVLIVCIIDDGNETLVEEYC